MKTWIVLTQHLENYGAHDGSDDKHYWKPKGGANYRVKLDDHSRSYDAIAVVAAKKCSADHHFVEFPQTAIAESQFIESIKEDGEEFQRYTMESIEDVEV